MSEKIKTILFWVSTVSLVLAIALVAVPRVFGMELRAIITGSMTPDIPVGSLVVIVPTKAEDIKVGDDISFVNAGDKVVTHRVVEIDRENNEFITWGIANPPNALDAPNQYENIIGVVRFHVPFLGRPFTWFSATHGKIITITAIAAIYILSAMVGIWTKKEKENKPVPIPNYDNPLPRSQVQGNAYINEYLSGSALYGPLDHLILDIAVLLQDDELLETLQHDEALIKLLG